MSDDLPPFMPADFSPSNDPFGPVEAICRTVNGLTIGQALDTIEAAQCAIAYGQYDPSTPRIDVLMGLIRRMDEDWAVRCLEGAVDLILDGHHVNVHSGRMSWMLDAARARKTPYGRNGI